MSDLGVYAKLTDEQIAAALRAYLASEPGDWTDAQLIAVGKEQRERVRRSGRRWSWLALSVEQLRAASPRIPTEGEG